MAKPKYRALFRLLLLFIFIFQLRFLCFSQTIIEDADGQDVLTYMGHPVEYPGGFDLLVNSKDNSLKILLNFEMKNVTSPTYHSIELKSKINEGILEIIKDKKITPGFSLAYRLVKTHFLVRAKDAAIDWISLKVGYAVNRFNVFNPEAPYSDQLRKIDSRRLFFSLNYSLLLKGNFVISLSGSYKRNNNYEDLPKVEVGEEARIFEDAITNSKLIVTNEKITAGEGKYVEFDSFPVKATFGYLPCEDQCKINKILPGYVFYITRDFNKMQGISNVGFNLYLTKADNKTGIRTAFIAFFIEAEDLFKEKKSEKNSQHRLAVGITLNLSLFNF